MGVAMGDFDGNGTPGFFIANDNARNLLLRSQNGKLEEIGIEAGVPPTTRKDAPSLAWVRTLETSTAMGGRTL